MSSDTQTGRVLRYQSGFFTIEAEDRRVTCILRGRLKRRDFLGDIIGIGDMVRYLLLPDGSGVIEEILPRTSELVRMDPTPKGEFCQILLSNPDQIVAVFACAHPSPHLRMLDRFLVIAEKQRLKAFIVANKVDLIGGVQEAQKIFGIYPKLGYPVIYTSALQGSGLEELHAILAGKVSALAGPSGVGKSSLLNRLQPGLGLAVREIGAYHDKGRHTTVVRELFPFEGGYVADLPGLRKLALWDTQPEELDGYFPELRDLVSQCQYNDCTHKDDPGCAVVRAVEEGRVSTERYESYLRLRAGDNH